MPPKVLIATSSETKQEGKLPQHELDKIAKYEKGEPVNFCSTKFTNFYNIDIQRQQFSIF